VLTGGWSFGERMVEG